MLLTGPSNTLTDFQAEFDGFLLGPGTPFTFEPNLDWLDMPALKTMDQARVAADGSWSGPDFADVRTITATIDISASPAAVFQAACAAYLQQFGVQTADLPLWMKLPGFPVMGIGARVTKRTLPIDIGFELSTLATAAVQWRSPNPAWQSLPRTTVLKPSTGASGLDFPLFTTWTTSTGNVLDFGVTSIGAYAAILTNAGNTDAAPLVAVQGPTNGWQITLDGHVIASTVPLAPNEVMTIDFATGRAQLSSYASSAVDRTYQLSSRDFAVVPAGGHSTITYTGTGGTATVTTADLWR